MIEKIESDIEILKNLIANLEIDIATIEKQLEISELTTDGNDSYFEWRASAVASASFKRVRVLAVKKQLTYWLSKRSEIKKIERKARRKAHESDLKGATERRKVREKEKTERHRINQEQNLMIFDEFKKLVKEKLGLTAYVDLIEKSRISVESGLYDNYGE